MQKSLVLTLTGKDQIGLVEKVTKTILEYNGNVDASRMARLGGEFAIIMLISIPAQQFDALVQGMQHLKEEGFAITTRPTEPVEPAKTTGWLPYQIEVKGADHEGIIHAIAQHLAEHRINVETMDTDMIKAPLSGTPLFTMIATVLVPPELTYKALQDDLESVGYDLNVDVEVTPFKG